MKQTSNLGKENRLPKEAIQAIIEHRKQGIRRMVVCLPTGAGKTVIFSTVFCS